VVDETHEPLEDIDVAVDGDIDVVVLVGGGQVGFEVLHFLEEKLLAAFEVAVHLSGLIADMDDNLIVRSSEGGSLGVSAGGSGGGGGSVFVWSGRGGRSGVGSRAGRLAAAATSAAGTITTGTITTVKFSFCPFGLAFGLGPRRACCAATLTAGGG